MLDHVRRQELALRLRRAIDRTLNEDQVRTGDLGGKASTADLTSALIQHIKND
jgi:isocitrate dehydrogenase (NAD+)